jgi:hypothetical protein
MTHDVQTPGHGQLGEESVRMITWVSGARVIVAVPPAGSRGISRCSSPGCEPDGWHSTTLNLLRSGI